VKPTKTPKLPPVYFSIDRTLLYNAFHADFGPLHIGHLYRFAVQLHEILSDPNHEDRPVVFWSGPDARSTHVLNASLGCKYTDISKVEPTVHVSWPAIWFLSNHGLLILHLLL
jgi:hypothetical protein